VRSCPCTDPAAHAVPRCVILLRLSVVMALNCARFASAAAALLLLLAGCGGGNQLEMVPLRGTVTYNGEPMTRGIVTYLPVAGSTGRTANGPIQADGTFVMTTQTRGDGVVRGSYKIVVDLYEENPDAPKTREEIEAQGNKTPLLRSLIPKRYLAPETSGLTDTVDEQHSGVKAIELVD